MKKICLLVGLLFVWGSVNAARVSDPYTEGFSNYYNEDNWTRNLDGGAIDTTGSPVSVTLISSNSGNGSSNQDFTIASAGNGLVSFDWNFIATDIDNPGYDPFGYLLNGVFTQVTDNAGSYLQTGTTSFAVSTGDIFGFRAHATDSVLGSSITVVTDFAAPVPIPGAALMLGSGLLALFGFGKKMSQLNS